MPYKRTLWEIPFSKPKQRKPTPPQFLPNTVSPVRNHSTCPFFLWPPRSQYLQQQRSSQTLSVPMIQQRVSVVFVHQPWSLVTSTRPCRQRGRPHIGRGKSIYCLAVPLQLNCAISNTRKVLLGQWLSYPYRLFTDSHLFFLYIFRLVNNCFAFSS